jgi:uncharacterized protein (DUF2384 family)
MLREPVPDSARPKPEPATVLSKAVTRAAERLAIPRAQLARILGLSAASVTRLHQGGYRLDPQRKEWELAALFVRVFRSLDSLVGDEATARAWLRSENLALHDRPINLIENTEGLVRVVQYLDAARGRV